MYMDIFTQSVAALSGAEGISEKSPVQQSLLMILQQFFSFIWIF